MAKRRQLTASQRKFKILYLEAIGKTGQRPNVAETLLKAGYSETTARHKAPGFLRHPLIGPDIEKALQEAESQARGRAIASREELLETLTKQARGKEPTEIHITVDPTKGKTVKQIIRKGDAIDKIFRARGDYAPQKHDVTHHDPLEQMDESELDEYIARNEALIKAIKRKRKKK